MIRKKTHSTSVITQTIIFSLIVIVVAVMWGAWHNIAISQYSTNALSATVFAADSNLVSTPQASQSDNLLGIVKQIQSIKLNGASFKIPRFKVSRILPSISLLNRSAVPILSLRPELLPPRPFPLKSKQPV